MSEENRPASYSNTDEAETLAVDTFEKILDHERIKSDIKKRDKYPNIDGYVEIVDNNRAPIAKLEVQIKKLPDGMGDTPKLNCPISLFFYSERACNPVLLIGVDTQQNKAYWFHISGESTRSLTNGNQKTKIVNFSRDNIIDEKNKEYIDKWKSISNVYQTKIQNYDKLKDSFNKLSEKSNPALGIVKGDFTNIHLFLDSFNNLLSKEFLIVKKRFYPNSWKIGLAYYRFENNMVHYALYPIPHNKNDVQIKEVNEDLHKQLERKGLGFTAHFVENPIKARPQEYALDIVESQILKLLKSRLLNHAGSEFLAKEFIFGFIDRFYQQMGLDKKDEYLISEIENAFYRYLPIWIDEAIKFLIRTQRNRIKDYKDCLYRRPYFDPDMLISQIMSDERKQIDASARERLEKSSIPQILVGNERFPLGIFTEFLEFLKSRNIKEITRVYSPKDYSRLRGVGGLIWNVHSPEAVKNNLKIFFDNLPTVYDELILQNFPKIKDKLPLFRDVAKVIIIFKVKEEYKSFKDSPQIKSFYLSDGSKDHLEFEIYESDENKQIESTLDTGLMKDINLSGKQYKLISTSVSILDFIYEDLPMFNFIYKILEENIKNYINSLKRD